MVLDPDIAILTINKHLHFQRARIPDTCTLI